MRVKESQFFVARRAAQSKSLAKSLWLSCLLGLCVAAVMSQTTNSPTVPAVPVTGQESNSFTFTNKYKEVIQAEVLRVDLDGIVYKLAVGIGGGKVYFTNLPVELQQRFGYDAEKVRKSEEERARARAAQEARGAKARLASRHDAIKEHILYYIRPISEYEFPKTEKAQTACKEIASELNGINKAIELGLSYAKFSDLLTEKVLSIEKIKDLRGEGIPSFFLLRVDGCVDAFKQSRHWWNKSIQDESPDMKALHDYFMRKYWSAASLRLVYCTGIARGNTNANALAIVQVAEMIKAEQDAVKAGILEAKDDLDPTVSNLTKSEILARLKEALSVTNTPSTEPKK